MSNDDKSKINADPNAQDPLFPYPIKNKNSSKDLTPNSALPIVKNRIFEMYDIHTEKNNSQNK